MDWSVWSVCVVFVCMCVYYWLPFLVYFLFEFPRTSGPSRKPFSIPSGASSPPLLYPTRETRSNNMEDDGQGTAGQGRAIDWRDVGWKSFKWVSNKTGHHV